MVNFLKRIFGKKDYSKYQLNIKKSKKDKRDYLKVAMPLDKIPSSWSIKQYCPPVRNQDVLGACNSFAGVECVEILDNINALSLFSELSPMYLYWEVRQKAFENTFPKDSGADGRHIMQVLNGIGAIPEAFYAYDDTDYNNSAIPLKKKYFNEGPTLVSKAFCTHAAAFWKCRYEACLDINAIKTSISNNQPIWLGIPVQNAIFSCNGITPLTYDKKKAIIGGHAITIVSYDDLKQAFEIMNSWDTSWGNNGFAWISYDYLANAPWFEAWGVQFYK